MNPTWDEVWNGTRMHKFKRDQYMYYDHGARAFRGPGFLWKGEFVTNLMWRGVTYIAPITNVSEVLTLAEYVGCPQGPLESEAT